MVRKVTKKVEEPEVAPEAPKATKVERTRVFYRELTPEGRTGAVSSKDFDIKADAEAFAATVGGTLKSL